MTKFNVAIIGCGAISKVHIQSIKSLQMSKLSLACDCNGAIAKEVGIAEKIDYVTDYKDVLSNGSIDVVHILTPHHLHCQMAKEALEAGKHVVLEKPVGIDYDEMIDLLETAKKTKVTIGITLQNRNNATVVKMKELVKSGVLGNFVSSKGLVVWNREAFYYSQSDWRGRLATEGGGLLINQAIHTLDLMEYIGGEIEFLQGNIMNYNHKNIEVEDTCVAQFYYKNGGVGNFYGTNNHGIDSDVELEFVYENATLRLLDHQLFMNNGIDNKLICTDLLLSGEKAYWGLGHESCIEDIYNAIIESREPNITLKDGIHATMLVLKIYESSRSNKKVRRI